MALTPSLDDEVELVCTRNAINEETLHAFNGLPRSTPIESARGLGIVIVIIIMIFFFFFLRSSKGMPTNAFAKPETHFWSCISPTLPTPAPPHHQH
jgi:hypothetical protein